MSLLIQLRNNFENYDKVFISAQQILEKLSIHKTKLLLKLNEKIKVLENLKSGHSCIKYVFLVSEYICDVFENLPEFRDWINQFQTIRKKNLRTEGAKAHRKFGRGWAFLPNRFCHIFLQFPSQKKMIKESLVLSSMQ